MDMNTTGSFTVKMNLLEEMTYGIEKLVLSFAKRREQNLTVAHRKIFVLPLE